MFFLLTLPFRIAFGLLLLPFVLLFLPFLLLRVLIKSAVFLVVASVRAADRRRRAADGVHRGALSADDPDAAVRLHRALHLGGGPLDAPGADDELLIPNP